MIQIHISYTGNMARMLLAQWPGEWTYLYNG